MIRLSAFADEASESVEEQIKALHRNRIPYIEVRALDGVNVSKVSEEDAKKYAARFAEEDIRVWSIGSPLGKIEIDCDFEEYKKTVRHVCRLAQIFNTDKIRIFSFFEAYGSEAKVFAYLQEMVDIAKEYGVTLYHENEKKIYGDTVERVLRIYENVKGIKLIYDPVNYIEVGADPTEALNILYGSVGYFHVKDMISDSKIHVPAGLGDGKIDNIVERIGDTDAVLTLEPHLMVFKGFAEIDGGELNTRFSFADGNAAFDAAAEAMRKILADKGYVFNTEKKGFERI